MNQSNRCPNCGSVANHIITDVQGENYYQCTRGLTSFREVKGTDFWDKGQILTRTSRIDICDTIISQGEVFNVKSSMEL